LLRDVFAFRFQILEDDTGEEARHKIENGFREVLGKDEDGEMKAHIFGQLLGFDFNASPHLKGVLNDAEQLRNRGLMYLIEYFKAFSREMPIVVFLEDIHWADDSSLDIIMSLGEQTPQMRLLIICAARLTLFERRPYWGKDQKFYTQIKLLPLSELESRSLLVEILQLVDEIPANLQEMVTKRAEGNPFYMEEMIKMLIEDGVIIPGLETWQVEMERMEQIEVPSTLAGVLQARLDSLPSRECTVLQQASVVGRLFWDRIVDYIQTEAGNGYDPQLIPMALNSLRDRELVYRREESAFEGAAEYLFKHDVLREVTYESVPKRLRKLHHGIVAKWFIANSRERLGENSGVIADHLERAGMFVVALSYLCQAGEFAAKRYSNSEAEAYFSRVLKVTKKVEPETDTSNSRLTAHISLGELQTLTCRFDEALKQFQLAQEILECNDFSEKLSFSLAELYRRIAVIFERQSEYETAFKWLNRGLNYIETGEPSVEAACMYLLGAGIFHRQGKNDDALDWCRKSNAISSQIETAEAKQSLAQAYYLEGAVQCRLGNLSKSIDLSKESLQIYKQIVDVLGQARAYNNISIACMDLGDWDQASENLQKSLEISQRIGDVFEQGSVQNNLACIQLDRGEWDQAKSLFLESIKIWKRIGASLPYAVTLSNLAQVYLYEKNWSEAYEILQESEGIFTEIGTVDYLSELERRWGEYFLGISDTGKALHHTQRSMELAEEHDSPLDIGMTLRVIGEIYIRLEEYDQAEKALVDSYETLQELGSEYEAAKTILALTHLALERDMDVDRDKVEVAIQTFERLNARADLINAQSLANRLS
jgi:tetratricopeptide (TPR) repeat protein